MSETEKYSDWAGKFQGHILEPMGSHDTDPFKSQDEQPRFCGCVSVDGRLIAHNEPGHSTNCVYSGNEVQKAEGWKCLICNGWTAFGTLHRCVKNVQTEFDPDADFKFTYLPSGDTIPHLVAALNRLTDTVERLIKNLEQNNET